MQPIILPGQVYLNTELNEYAVVTKANRGEIKYAGPGYAGMLDVERFLERFGPVDPSNLEPYERSALEGLMLTTSPLKVGWVQTGGIEDDEDQ